MNTLNFGNESLSSLSPKIWELVPDTIKNEKSLPSFKSQIIAWAMDEFVKHAEFVNL